MGCCSGAHAKATFLDASPGAGVITRVGCGRVSHTQSSAWSVCACTCLGTCSSGMAAGCVSGTECPGVSGGGRCTYSDPTEGSWRPQGH